MGFHEVRFPANLSFGSVGGPERRTEIVTLTNGFEERNTPWAHSRRRYDAGVGLRSPGRCGGADRVFRGAAGQLYGFRWKDWADYKSCPSSQGREPRGSADRHGRRGDARVSAVEDLSSRASRAMCGRSPSRWPGTVLVGGRRGCRRSRAIDFSVDLTTGDRELCRSRPAAGVAVTAGFEFDVPVRFDTDRIQTSVASFQAGDVPQVPVVEVRV